MMIPFPLLDCHGQLAAAVAVDRQVNILQWGGAKHLATCKCPAQPQKRHVDKGLSLLLLFGVGRENKVAVDDSCCLLWLLLCMRVRNWRGRGNTIVKRNNWRRCDDWWHAGVASFLSKVSRNRAVMRDVNCQ